ncbi:MAG: hypothetical protein HYY49_02110 [Ignavibacteriales bacterium]|nr:hypothetical protein [Ignavibacteriales bacterium]
MAHYSEGGPFVKRSQHRVEFGLLTEKDPGERALNDFVAGYFMANVPSMAGKIIVGDFVVESGEGLVLWRSVGFSKGSEVISPLQKRGTGMKPYLSTDENLFFRGAAMEWRAEKMALTVFHSNKPITASINAEGDITSLFSDGYHRTAGELAKKNNSREKTSGFRVDLMPIDRVKLGATAYQAQFAHGLFLNEASGYLGDRVSAGGLDFSYTDKRVSIFSEVAKTKSNSLASVAGVVFEPDRRVNVALVARYYPRGFANIHAFGFRESGSLTQNESGIYFGARFLITKSIRLAAYYDQFRFPWRTSSLELPASGNDFLLLSDMSVARNIDLQILYKNRHKPFSMSETDPYGRLKDVIRERNQRNYRATLRFISSAVAEWKSRFEMVDVFYPRSTRCERGLLWMQDARLRPGMNLTVDARVIIFQTDSFDSRVYEFESDVRGTFSNPALFGKGIRWYILTRHRLSGNFEASAKYSRTIKDGVKTLSSGLSEIIGDSDGQLSFQVDVIF